MRSFDAIFDQAAARHGGSEAFEATLDTPRPIAELTALPDDRWLSEFSKRIFQSGFNWKVVENKWPRFEEVFEGFSPGAMALMSDEDLDRFLKTEGIVRHAKKILSIRDNGIFLCDLARAHGTAAAHLGAWPVEDHAGLLLLMKKRGARLGGMTGAIALRFLGKDGFMPSPDVVTALHREGVIDGPPSSQKAMHAIQAAFNTWADQSGRPHMQISRTLACSV